MPRSPNAPAGPPAITPAEHLLVLPLPCLGRDGSILYDLQSRDSLSRYLNYFDSLIVAQPRWSEETAARKTRSSGFVWVPVDDLRDRIQFVPLPETASMRRFLLQDRAPTVRLLRRCIDAAQFLQCAIGGGNGGLEYDWGAVAAYEAIRAGRKFSLLSDRISSEAILTRLGMYPGPAKFPQRMKLRLKARMVRSYHGALISRCDLMFCNGMDTFQAYRPLCKREEVAVKINDFQIGRDQLLGADEVDRKCEQALSRSDLRVAYVGRAEPEKGPLDWVRALHEARGRGASIRGTWLGEGSQHGAMVREAERLEMTDVIDLPGFVSDRDRVIGALRDADVMPFAHIEPESPRNLIEALMSACPIVGYDRPHPRDLISSHGGGIITPLGDWRALGAALADLAADRPRLADLMRRAWQDGSGFDSEALTRNRSALIRERLA